MNKTVIEDEEEASFSLDAICERAVCCFGHLRRGRCPTAWYATAAATRAV